MTKPLDGLLVVAVEQAVAAPYCTERLADAGARVIKIERAEGDFSRGYDDIAHGESSYFVWLNRGKESVVLDLASETGRAQLEGLIGRADILVQNLRAGAFGRMGMPIEALRRDHPALICCSISGYGETGPLVARKAYDLLIQAETGLAVINGAPGAPARVGFSVVDIATGANALSAVLEAVIQRFRTGAGADIRLSMFDVMADWLTVPLLHGEAGKPPQQLGLAHPSIAPYGAFTLVDGKQILICIQSDREWRDLCREVLLAPELGTDRRFATNRARVENRFATDQAVATILGQLSRDDAVSRLTAGKIAFADVNDLAALAAHPHLRRMEVKVGGGSLHFPPPAAIVSGRAATAGGRVPRLGEHTGVVLAEFGLAAAAPGENR